MVLGHDPDPQHGDGIHVLTLALAVGAAAPPDMVIEATVHPGLRRITGTLRGTPGSLVDPLAHLPEPPDDLTLLRTYPGAPDTGSVRWEGGDGVWTFESELPRRFGALGATAKGLFANGGWYPQDPALPTQRWDVTVTLPPGATGALGDTAGTGELHWIGTAERASLAVVRHGVLTPVRDRGVQVTLLTRGRPRKVVVEELSHQLPLAAGAHTLEGVVVVAPLRRRLVRHGPGMAYLSDRAWRLTRGLQRFHRVAAVRGVVAALVDDPDPFRRELAAAALSEDHQRQLAGENADRLLRRFAWVPQVDWLLSSRRLPFYAEVLEWVHPLDPVQDDLAEVFAPATAGAVVHAQLDDVFGPGTGYRVGRSVLLGHDDARAEEEASLPPGWLAPWRRPYPRQDYILDEVRAEPPGIVVTRSAPADAQDEVLVVRIDDALVAWPHPGGTATLSLAEAPERVTLDPVRHTRQLSRNGDSWPPRYRVTLAAWIEGINLNRGQVYGAGSTTLRRQDDTHNLAFGSAFTRPGTLVGTTVGFLRKEGPLIDGITRPHRLSTSVGASLLDPAFANVDRHGRFALSSRVGYAWDNRVHVDFPLRGRRLGVGVGGGAIPGLDERWASADGTATGVVALHPRHALAGRATLAIATSNARQRLLGLGGLGTMRSIPVLPACPNQGEPCIPRASRRAFGTVEYRLAVVRNASVPAWLAWGSELQLSAGAEAVAADVDGAPAEAVGITAGLGGIADILGAQPSLMGVTAGWPVWWRRLPLEHQPLPELYLRWSQPF